MKMSTLVVLFISMSMVSVTAQSVRYHTAQPCISLSAYSLKQNDPLSFTSGPSKFNREAIKPTPPLA